MRLPCDNITEFIDGIKRHYAVENADPYTIGDRVTLYNGNHEHEFVVANIIYIEPPVLTLLGVRYYETSLVHEQGKTNRR